MDEASEAARIGAGEAVAGEEIGAVEEELVDRVAPILEARGEGQALGAEKNRDDGAPRGEAQAFVEHADALPLPERRGLGGEGEALGAVGTAAAAGEGFAFATDQPGPAGIRKQTTGKVGAGWQRGGGLGAEAQRGFGEEAGGGIARQIERGLARRQAAEQGGPGEGGRAFQPEGRGAAQPRGAPGDEHVAGLVEAAAPGAPDHLQQLVGGDVALERAHAVARGGEHDRAQGEVYPGGETEGGDDGAQLTGLGERLDQAGALGVREAAVVVGDATMEELGEGGAGDGFLLRGEGQRIREGQLAGQLAGEALGVGAMRGKHEHGSEVFAQGAGHAAGPETADLRGQAMHEIVDLDLLERDGPGRGADDGDLAAEAGQPSGDVVGIGHGAGEEEQLHRGGQGGEHALVVVAPRGIAEPLVFVDHEQVGKARGGGFGKALVPGGGSRAEEGALGGLEGGDDGRGVEVDGEVAGADADAPAAGAPLGEFVVGEGAGGHGEDGAAGEVVLLDETFEDVGFARAGGGVDDHIPAGSQRVHGVSLPGIGQHERLQTDELAETHGRGA